MGQKRRAGEYPHQGREKSLRQSSGAVRDDGNLSRASTRGLRPGVARLPAGLLRTVQVAQLTRHRLKISRVDRPSMGAMAACRLSRKHGKRLRL